MIINVTEKHIANGKRNCPSGCPLALALVDAGLKCVAVVMDSIEFGTDLEYFQVYLSQLDFGLEISEFIYAFDLGQKVSPILFELEVEKP